MVRAIEPRPAKNGAYVVPLPRVTDALGRSLRQAFAPPPPDDFTDLLRRLDAIH